MTLITLCPVDGRWRSYGEGDDGSLRLLLLLLLWRDPTACHHGPGGSSTLLTPYACGWGGGGAMFPESSVVDPEPYVLGLPDPHLDPLVKWTDPAPDPSIIKQN
jgi:hypothetical protein